MRRRLLSLLLILALLSAVLPGAALAAGGDLAHFTAQRAYEGQFADVPSDAWYSGSVSTLYSLGLTDGTGMGTFGPAKTVTVAEVLSFAARIHSTYYFGDARTGPARFAGLGGVWYSPYVDYLRAAQVIDGRFDSLFARPATRGQVAYILCRTLPEAALAPRSGALVDAAYASGRYIRDVTAATPYAADILRLYRCGIVAGSDAAGSYRPASSITRSELAAMLTRLVDPALRLDLKWSPESIYTAKGVTYADLIRGSATLHTSHALDDTAAIADNVRYLFRNNRATLQLRLGRGTLNYDSVDDLLDRYLDAAQLYLEQGYNHAACQYDSQGNFTLTLSNARGGDRDAALRQAIAVHDQLWAEGTLHFGMSQREIAQVYCEYLCRTCEYDYSFRDVSHTAYGALCTGSAVCEGYTAAYNLFLKLEGIDCATADTPDHIWTTATLDGTLWHIDVTWVDQPHGIDSRYFCMTPEFALSRSDL